MKYTEFRRIIDNYEQKVETHDNSFSIMCNYTEINGVLTLYGLNDIHLVNPDKDYSDENKDIDIWFGENIHMDLEDLESLRICEVRRYQ